MKDDEPNIIDHSIKENFCPLCVNVSRLGAYLLPPDEVIFFDWAVTKSAVCFNFQPFYYSQERIEAETRIKRRALERIIKRFSAFGILEIETKMKPGNVGHSRYYNINFAEVVKRLPELIDQSHQHYEAMQLYFSALAKFQKTPPKQSRKKSSRSSKNGDAAKVINILNKQYADRVELYNNGGLGRQSEKPKRGITPVQFERSAALDRMLSRLGETYDEKTISMAALAFFDWYLMEGKKQSIQSPIAYFLKFDEVEGVFTTFTKFLQVFRKDYSYNNE